MLNRNSCLQRNHWKVMTLKMGVYDIPDQICGLPKCTRGFTDLIDFHFVQTLEIHDCIYFTLPLKNVLFNGITTYGSTK